MKDCAVALAHRDLPALTILCITASTGSHGFRELLPYVARYAHGPQDAQPLQSVLIRSDWDHADNLAWPVPNIDTEVQDPATLLAATLPARVTLSFPNWGGDTPTIHIGMAMATLPLESIVTFVAQDFKNPLEDVSWLCNLLKWPRLRRMRLGGPVEGATYELLLSNVIGLEPSLASLLSPSFSLKELALVENMRNWIRVITVRVGQPLELLDLRLHPPIPHYPAYVEDLSKIGVKVLAP